MKYISTRENFSDGEEHFAALIFSSIYIEGDERSRTNPGHGYPAHNQPVVNYIEFESEEEMQGWVARETKHQTPPYKFKLIKCKPLRVKTQVTVETE